MSDVRCGFCVSLTKDHPFFGTVSTQVLETLNLKDQHSENCGFLPSDKTKDGNENRFTFFSSFGVEQVAYPDVANLASKQNNQARNNVTEPSVGNHHCENDIR